MEALNYIPFRADTDVWMRKTRKSDGNEYYEYMLLYVDDCLAIYENPKEAVLQLDKFSKMQQNSISPPDIYLGRKVKKMRLPNMVEACTFRSSQYVQEAVCNFEKLPKILMDLCCPQRLTLPYPMTIDLNWIALLNWMELMELTINN